MRKLLYSILFVGALIACEKDEIEFLDQEVARVEEESIQRDQDNANALAVAQASLQAAIDAEKAAREAGDANLSANLSEAVATLSSAIADEANARAAGDAQLAADLKANIDMLVALLAKEEEARIAGDQANADALADAVGALSAALSAERNARIAGDANLSAAISSLNDKLLEAVAILEAADAAIKAASEAGDDRLNERITRVRDNLRTRINNVRQNVKQFTRDKVNELEDELEQAIADLKIVVDGNTTAIADLQAQIDAIDFTDATELEAAINTAVAALTASTTAELEYAVMNLTNSINSVSGWHTSQREALDAALRALIAAIPADDDQALLDAIAALEARIAALEADTPVVDPFEGKTITLETTNGTEYVRTRGYEIGEATGHQIQAYLNGEHLRGSVGTSVTSAWTYFSINLDEFEDGDVLTFTILHEGEESEVLYTYTIDKPDPFEGTGIEFVPAANGYFLAQTTGVTFNHFINIYINDELSHGGAWGVNGTAANAAFNPENYNNGDVLGFAIVFDDANGDRITSSILASTTIDNPLNINDYVFVGDDVTGYDNGNVRIYYDEAPGSSTYERPPGYANHNEFYEGLVGSTTGEASVTSNNYNSMWLNFSDGSSPNTTLTITHPDLDGEVTLVVDNPIYEDPNAGPDISNAGLDIDAGSNRIRATTTGLNGIDHQIDIYINGTYLETTGWSGVNNAAVATVYFEDVPGNAEISFAFKYRSSTGNVMDGGFFSETFTAPPADVTAARFMDQSDTSDFNTRFGTFTYDASFNVNSYAGYDVYRYTGGSGVVQEIYVYFYDSGSFRSVYYRNAHNTDAADAASYLTD